MRKKGIRNPGRAILTIYYYEDFLIFLVLKWLYIAFFTAKKVDIGIKNKFKGLYCPFWFQKRDYRPILKVMVKNNSCIIRLLPWPDPTQRRRI